jgi:hypothetical protein
MIILKDFEFDINWFSMLIVMHDSLSIMSSIIINTIMDEVHA